MRGRAMARFDGKVILISGGARGQGATEARILVAEGAKVVIGDVLDDKGRDLERELGSAARYVHHDVTKEADWSNAIQVAECFGGLHGLINNAGVFTPKTMTETDTALWEHHVQVNQFGCFLGMKSVVAPMERAGGGAIVNISSNAGLQGTPRAFAYGATKWALRGMTKSAALELAPKHIRVNSVHPGPIDTDMLLARSQKQNEEFLKTVPMARMGTVDEVAHLVLFLLSDVSQYITGAEIAIDGGISA